MNEHTPENNTPQFNEPEYDELGFIKPGLNIPEYHEPEYDELGFIKYGLNIPEYNEYDEPVLDESQNNESGLNKIELDETEEKEGKTIRVRMELYDWLQCVVTAIICGILIFVLVGRTIGVDGRSMLQTLQDKDRVVISNLFYTPANGTLLFSNLHPNSLLFLS